MGFFKDIGDSIMGAAGIKKNSAESMTNPYQGQQNELIAKLQARANGQEPSLAEAQTRLNFQRALSDQVAALRSTSGLNPALQARIANQAGQQNVSDIAQQSTLSRLAEQDAATQQLTSALFGASEQDMKRNVEKGKAADNRYDRFAKLMGGGGGASAEGAKMMGGGAGAGGAGAGAGGAAAASDKNAKENIKDSEGAGGDLLDHLKGKLYEYKDNSNGEGVHIGIMAQDLEKTPLGKSMVFEEGGIKKVDYGKGFGAVLAAMTELNDRLKTLEGK